MLQQGVVRRARSPRNSPIVLAKKEGGRARRLCNDFRAINEVTTGDQFPLPNVDDCLATLAGSQYFTTLDCQSGYWQVPMDEDSKAITAFQAGNYFFEYEVMPFGLKNAPSAFQRMITQVLAGHLWVDCFVYIDDIVIGGATLERHLEVLRQVLERLRAANLLLKPKKCHFLKSKVRVLGFIVSREGVEADLEKVRAVRDFPTPLHLKAVRSFLGLCSYYRRFIRGFAQMAAPLHALSKKDVPFEWKQEQ